MIPAMATCVSTLTKSDWWVMDNGTTSLSCMKAWIVMTMGSLREKESTTGTWLLSCNVCNSGGNNSGTFYLIYCCTVHTEPQHGSQNSTDWIFIFRWTVPFRKPSYSRQCGVPTTCWASQMFSLRVSGRSVHHVEEWSSYGSPVYKETTAEWAAHDPTSHRCHSRDALTCWVLLRRWPACSVCSTWIRMYSWLVRSTIPPVKGPPTWSFKRALSRKSVRFIAARCGTSRENPSRVKHFLFTFSITE